VSLKGSLDTMALPDLLQWLGAARKTGLLALTQGSVCKKLILELGIVTGSVSNDPSDFLGQFLLSYGRITEEQLRDALASQKGTTDYLGMHFVRMGALTEPELMRMLALKTEETIYSLFSWEQAQFEYQDGAREGNPFPVALRVDDIMLKGTRRFDEMSRIREQIPSNASIPRRTKAPLPAQVVSSPNLKRLADAIDGARSVASIALHTHTSEFLVSKFLFEALRAGIVEMVTERVPEVQKASPELLRAAQRLFEGGDYEAVLTLVRQENVDGDLELQGLVKAAEERFVESTYTNSMNPYRVPMLTRTPAELLSERLSPEEYFLISRINGNWDIRSIISVSPMREAEALHVLNRLQKRGFIAFKEPVHA
jgi:hypothetical protein